MTIDNSFFSIGITGHRDLIENEVELIKTQLRERFSSIKARLPNTEVKLFSGMADGADRVAAIVALECGLTVEVILPMPLQHYKSDFSEESFNELEAFFENENVVVIESVFSTTLAADAFSDQLQRNRCYAEMGQELIDRSIILLCLWDGQNSAEEGGTSDIVLRFLDSGRFDDGIDKISFNRADVQHDAHLNTVSKLLLWLPVNRQKNPTLVCSDLSLKIVAPDNTPHALLLLEHYPNQFILQLEALECYNTQYQSMSHADKNVYDNRLTVSIDWIDQPTQHHLDEMDKAFVKADNMSMYHQKFSDRNFKIFAYMAASMGVLFLVYAKIVAAKIFIILYTLLFLFGLLMFKKAEKQNSFAGHLTSRIIAETFRVKIFLALAGINETLPVEKLFKLSGVKQFSGFNWISWVIKPLTFKPHFHVPALEGVALKYTITHWVEDQASYFSRKSDLLAEQHHKLERIKKTLLAGSFVAALALIFFKQSLVSMIIAGDFSMKSLLVFLMGLLPLLLGIWELYQGKMAIKELHWQYKNQTILFKSALDRIQSTIHKSHQRKIIFELAECCLMENYLWSIHRYHREHEPPAAG